MSAIKYGLSTSSIRWEPADSDLQINNTGGVVINVTGTIDCDDGSFALSEAITLIPDQLPISNDGPIGNSTDYSEAKLTDSGARYLGDGTIQITATYEIAEQTGIQPGADPLTETADTDRAIRSIVAEEVPILAHPVVREFPAAERSRLASLLAGDVQPNPRYNPDGSGSELWEFRQYTEDGNDFEEVIFSDTEYTTEDEITSSPLNYARLIAIGITSYRRPMVRHTITRQRNEPVSNNVLSKVGEALDITPALAPDLQGGQWFFNGVNDSTSNGILWTSQFEFEYTASGGALKDIYKGGEAEV